MDNTARVYEENVPCNLCGSREVRVMPRHAIAKHAELRDSWGCTFVECMSCGLRFYSPRLEENYAVKTFLHGNDAEAEAESMAQKGVFFGEPQGSPSEQLETLRKYYTTIFDGLVPSTRSSISGRRSRCSNSAPRSACSPGQHVLAPSNSGAQWTMPVATLTSLRPKSTRKDMGLDIQGTTFSKYEIRPDQLGRYDLLIGARFPRAQLHAPLGPRAASHRRQQEWPTGNKDFRRRQRSGGQLRASGVPSPSLHVENAARSR